MNKRLIRSVVVMLAAFWMLTAMNTTAYATDVIDGLKQTDAGKTTVEFKWTDASAGTENAYQVYWYSKSKKLIGSKVVKAETAKIGKLEAGKSYYVRVALMDTSVTPATEVPGTMSEYFEIVTCPDMSEAVVAQVGQSTNMVRLKISGVIGANQYGVIRFQEGNAPDTYKPKRAMLFQSKKFEVKAAKNTVNRYCIYPQRVSASGFVAMNTSKGIKVKTYVVPTKVKGLDLVVWYPSKKPLAVDSFPGFKSNKAVVDWINYTYADGYKVILYSLEGKKLGEYTYNNNKKERYEISFIMSEIRAKGFKVKVRAYKEINGKIKYGEYSNEKVFIPQADIIKITGDYKTRTIYWKPVDNAQKYLIYRIRNGKPTVVGKLVPSGEMLTYTVAGLKKGDGLAVGARVQVGDKLYYSPIRWCVTQNVEE